jgi:hypothetical protein
LTFVTTAAEGWNVDDVAATLRGGLMAAGDTTDDDSFEEGALRCDSVVINAKASVPFVSFL